MLWFSNPNRSFKSINRRNRRIARVATTVASSAVNRAIQRGESLEARRMLATLNGTANADIITVDISGVNIVLTLNGTPTNFSDAANIDIIVNGNGGADTVTVISNGANPTTINGGDGDDTINIGNGVVEGQILSAVSVNGNLNVDTIVYNDSGAAAGDSYTINGGSISRTGVPSTTINSTETLRLESSGLADTVNVISTFASIDYTTNLNGGADAIEISSSATFGDLSDFINGSVTVNGGAGIDTITYNDTDNLTADTYTMSSPTFTTSTMGGVAINFATTELQVIIPSAGALAQTFDIVDPGSDDVSINGGDGNDTFNLAGGDFDLVFEDVSITGGNGTDRINVNDSTDLGGIGWTLSTASLQKGGGSLDSVFPTTVEQLNLDGGTGSELFTVSGMIAGLNTTLSGGTGNDTLTTGTTPDDLDNTITGNLTFLGGADVDLITLSDSEVADGGENYTIDFNSIDKTAATFGALSYSTTTENILLIGDDDDSTITIGAIGSGQSFTINGGSGNDTFVNDAGNDWTTDWDGDMSLSGGAGVDVLTLNNSADASVNTYTMNNVFFESELGDTSGVIAYSSFAEFSWTDSATASTFDFVGVNSTLTGVTLNAGDGNDTINVGGTGNDFDDILVFGGDVSSISIVGGLGTDSLHFRDTDNEVGDDTYLLDDPSLTVGPGGANPVVFNWTGMESLALDGSDLAHTYELEDTAFASAITGGTANDSFVIAPTSQQIDALAATTIIGGGGTDTITANDENDSFADTYTFNANLMSKSGFAGLRYGDIARFNLDANGDNNIIDVNVTNATTVYDLNGGVGNDTFNVSSLATGNLDNVLGVVTLLGSAGTDSVNYNDQLNATPGTTYFIGSDAARQRVTRTGAADVIIGVDNESITFNTAVANSTINFDGWNGSFNSEPTLNAGAGNDTIFVGNGDFDTNIQEPIRIDPGAGLDILIFNDATDNDTGDTYGVNASNITDSGALAGVQLNFDSTDTESVIMHLPGGNETVNIETASASVTVNAGLGNDTLNVTPLNGEIDVFNGDNLLFNGDGGNDQMVLHNTLDTAAFNNTMTFNAVTATETSIVHEDETPIENINFNSTVELVTVNDGAGAYRFVINALHAGTGVTINGGAGNDTLDYGGTGNNVDPIDSTITFGGGVDVDRVNYNDSSAPAGRTYQIEDSLLDTNVSSVLNYSAEAVVVNAGVGNDTMLIEGAAAGTTYDIGAGPGTDRFDVGDTTNDIDFNILSTMILGGGAGNDTINYNDTGDAADPESYTFDAGDVFAKNSLPLGVVIDGNLIETTVLNANNGSNAINVNTAPTNLTVNANGGDDDINVFDATTQVIVSSGAGADRVDVDPDADALEADVVFAGTDEIVTATIGSGSQLNVASGSTLIFTGSIGGGWSGVLDVNNGFVINRVGGTPLATWTSGLLNGYAAGLWNGVASINSSAAAATPRSDGVGIRLATDPNLAGANVVTFGGQAVNPGDVLMAFVQNGDTDLDRDVDFDDLLRLAQNYSLGAPRAWTQGSFDYDNDVDFDDLLGLAQNYGAPFMTVSPTDDTVRQARSSLAEASKRRGMSASFRTAMSNALRNLESKNTDSLFSTNNAIA